MRGCATIRIISRSPPRYSRAIPAGPLLDRSGHVVGVVSAKLDALEVVDAYGDIPQNVNFAIKGRVVAAFLNRSQVSPIAEDSIAPLSAADVGELARRYTVLVECWK